MKSKTTTKRDEPSADDQLRTLSHGLSNALEAILQAEYLLTRTKLPSDAKKWAAMIANAAHDAMRMNREIRDVLRSQSEKAGSGKHAADPAKVVLLKRRGLPTPASRSS